MTRHPMDNVQTYEMIKEVVEGYLASIRSNHLYLKGIVDGLKERIESLEKKPGIVDRRIIMSWPESPVVTLPKDPNVQVQHHPSRQHLEKTLCEKNKKLQESENRITELMERIRKLEAGNFEFTRALEQKTREWQYALRNSQNHFDDARRFERQLQELKMVNAELSRQNQCKKICCLPPTAPSDAIAGCYPFSKIPESKL